MKNRYKPANPVPSNVLFDEGLTKLEYAAIHILAGSGLTAFDTASHKTWARMAISKANALFDELEKHND